MRRPTEGAGLRTRHWVFNSDRVVLAGAGQAATQGLHDAARHRVGCPKPWTLSTASVRWGHVQVPQGPPFDQPPPADDNSLDGTDPRAAAGRTVDHRGWNARDDRQTSRHIGPYGLRAGACYLSGPSSHRPLGTGPTGARAGVLRSSDRSLVSWCGGLLVYRTSQTSRAMRPACPRSASPGGFRAVAREDLAYARVRVEVIDKGRLFIG